MSAYGFLIQSVISGRWSVKHHLVCQLPTANCQLPTSAPAPRSSWVHDGVFSCLKGHEAMPRKVSLRDVGSTRYDDIHESFERIKPPEHGRNIVLPEPEMDASAGPLDAL